MAKPQSQLSSRLLHPVNWIWKKNAWHANLFLYSWPQWVLNSASLPPTKNYLTQTVKSVEIEMPCYSLCSSLRPTLYTGPNNPRLSTQGHCPRYPLYWLFPSASRYYFCHLKNRTKTFSAFSSFFSYHSIYLLFTAKLLEGNDVFSLILIALFPTPPLIFFFFFFCSSYTGLLTNMAAIILPWGVGTLPRKALPETHMAHSLTSFNSLWLPCSNVTSQWNLSWPLRINLQLPLFPPRHLGFFFHLLCFVVLYSAYLLISHYIIILCECLSLPVL